jgi:hypothetical protein
MSMDNTVITVGVGLLTGILLLGAAYFAFGR